MFLWRSLRPDALTILLRYLARSGGATTAAGATAVALPRQGPPAERTADPEPTPRS